MYQGDEKSSKLIDAPLRKSMIVLSEFKNETKNKFFTYQNEL